MKDPDNHNRLIINPDNYKYIKYIFNEASKGIPPSIIAKNLNLMGVITPKDYINSKLNKVGGKLLWKYNMILKILNNETYVGDLIQHKYKRVSYKIYKLVNTNESERIIVRNAHESIIDKKTFQKVKDILKRDTRKKNNDDFLNTYSGFLKCGDCNNSIVINKSYKNINYYTYTTSLYRLF